MLVLGNFRFQLYQDVALQYAVVEDQVDEIILIADQQPFLPRFKTESVPEFYDKLRCDSD